MRRQEYDTMFSNEDAHWWFVGTRQVILDLAVRALRSSGSESGARVLDVGCGTGATLARLSGSTQAFGVELSEAGVRYCHRRGLPRVGMARAERLPFASGSFDLVLALDVVEHIEDDAAAVAELVRVVRPGGHVLVTVPAHPFLWSRHDVALHHVRRYRRAELRSVLEGAGLTVRVLSWYNSALFPVVAAVRIGQRLARAARLTGGQEDEPKSDVEMPPAPVNAALAALLGAERWAVGRVPMPVGVSLIALCEK